jgi:hypothetical protein
MSKRQWLSCAMTIVLVAMGACGGDATTRPNGEDLSADQVKSMTTALSFVLGIALGQPTASLASPAHVGAIGVMATALPVAGSLSCPEGGHVGTNGTFSSDMAGAVFNLTDTLVACAVKDNHSNVWSFTSKPTIAVTIDQPTNIHGDSIDVAHSTLIQFDSGTVHYATGSLSGTCTLSVGMRLDVTRGTPTVDSATVALSGVGTVCGQSVMWLDTTTTTLAPPLP